MEQVLETAHSGQHREDRFHDHTLIPGSLGTELQVSRNSLDTGKSQIGQGDRLSFERLNQGQEGLVVDIGRIPIPDHYFTAVIDHPTQFHSDDPTAVGLALFAQLLLAASLAPGVDQFDAIAVHNGEETGIGQEGVTPILMSLEQPLQTSPLGQIKPRTIVAFQPAVESAELHALEGKEQTNRDQFTGIEVRLGVFGQVADSVVYQTEEMDDKIQSGHGFRPSYAALQCGRGP